MPDPDAAAAPAHRPVAAPSARRRRPSGPDSSIAATERRLAASRRRRDAGLPAGTPPRRPAPSRRPRAADSAVRASTACSSAPALRVELAADHPVGASTQLGIVGAGISSSQPPPPRSPESSCGGLTTPPSSSSGDSIVVGDRRLLRPARRTRPRGGDPEHLVAQVAGAALLERPLRLDVGAVLVDRLAPAPRPPRPSRPRCAGSAPSSRRVVGRARARRGPRGPSCRSSGGRPC